VTQNNFNKIVIAKILSDKKGFSILFSKKIVEDLLEILKINILRNNLKLKNIGSFKIINKSERIGRNPKTKEIFKITSRKSISFISSKNLKKFFNKNG
jgi:Bacterial nucleoid DNA-binding protein